MKKVTIIVIIIIVAFLLIGAVKGFPWEHIIATSRAKKYVMEKYQLTPTKAKYHLSIADGSQRVEIYTKEWDFSFNVYVGRINEIGKYSDNYLHKLSEYYLTKDLNDYIKEITDDKGMANASLFIGKIKGYTLSDFEENPNIVFEKLQDSYWLHIKLYDNIAKNNYNIDYDLIYNIYNRMLENGMIPRAVTISYYDGKISRTRLLYVKIDKKHFTDINSLDDLKPFFEEEISKIKGR